MNDEVVCNSSSSDFDKLLEDSPLIKGVEGDVAFTVISVLRRVAGVSSVGIRCLVLLLQCLLLIPQFVDKLLHAF